MVLGRGQRYALGIWILNNVNPHLTGSGRTTLAEMVEIDAAATLLHTVFVTHGATVKFPNGERNAVTESDGNISIPLGASGLDRDDYIIDSLFFEAGNSHGHHTRTSLATAKAGATLGAGDLTRSAGRGKAISEWEFTNMVTYIKVADQIPPGLRTTNMARAVVDWYRAGGDEVRFVDRAKTQPHEREHVVGGVPVDKMGLPAPVLYSYEYICSHKDHQIVWADLFYAVYKCNARGTPAQWFGSSHQARQQAVNPRTNTAYDPGEVATSIALSDWIRQHWPNRNMVNDTGGFPSRVVFVHDIINACQGMGGGSPFLRVTPAAFGLNGHTEAVAVAAAPGQVRRTYP